MENQNLNQNKMTPKEKAKELLFQKFGCKKQYALSAVDEALAQYVECYNKMKNLHPYMIDVWQSKKHNYWQEVKQEIINL